MLRREALEERERVKKLAVWEFDLSWSFDKGIPRIRGKKRVRHATAKFSEKTAQNGPQYGLVSKRKKKGGEKTEEERLTGSKET